MDALDSTASARHTRAIRSFAQREDAERALAALADSNIDSTIREFRVPDPVTGKLVTRGCSICVDPADAAAAARLMLKMPPSEAPVAARARPEGPSRLRTQGRRGPPQKSSIFMISFAIICAAGMILFVATGLLGRKKPQPPKDTENHLLEEDLNGDNFTDVWREFTPAWVPLYHAEDRNFDSLIDHRWNYQKGKPSSSDVDLNSDGKFDEHTTCDPEGQPFYTDTRPGAEGPVLVRKILRQGFLWKILEDRDADNHFDHLTEFDITLSPIREEELPADSAENNPPPWPPPPWPDDEENEPERRMEVKSKP